MFSLVKLGFVCEHPFIDKTMFITEPAVPRARILGLVSRLFSSNMLRKLNKDLTRFSSRPKSIKRKQGFASRVFTFLLV